MLETREVEAFLAVAEHLHFGRAAQQLRLTPSRVSQTIRVLERRIGGSLFERTSRRVVLTPLGRQLLAQWRPAYAQLSTALSEARQAASGPVATRLRVGYPATLPPGTLDVITDSYRAGRPANRLLWVQDRMVDMYAWSPGVDLGLDAVVGWLPPGGAPWNGYLRVGKPIQRRGASVVVGHEHPLSRRTEVDVEELAGYPLLQPEAVAEAGMEWVPATTPGGRPLQRVVRPSRHLESLIAAAVDDGLAHLTFTGLEQTPAWNLVRGAAVLVPVTGLPPFTLRAVWPGESEAATAAAEFAELACQAGAAAGWLALANPSRRS